MVGNMVILPQKEVTEFGSTTGISLNQWWGYKKMK
jgi:hypothetical protein